MDRVPVSVGYIAPNLRIHVFQEALRDLFLTPSQWIRVTDLTVPRIHDEPCLISAERKATRQQRKEGGAFESVHPTLPPTVTNARNCQFHLEPGPREIRSTIRLLSGGQSCRQISYQQCFRVSRFPPPRGFPRLRLSRISSPIGLSFGSRGTQCPTTH